MVRPYLRLFFPDADNPAEQLQAEQATATAERLKITMDVEFAGGDFALQVRQIYKATRQEVEKPDVVIVMPVQEAALKTLSESTVGAGTGWVFLNRSAGNVPALRQLNPAVAVSFVTPDQKEIGRIHARQLRRLFPDGANILYVQGRVTTSSAEARHAGLREALATPGPKIEVVSALDGNWSAKDTQATLVRWLQLMLPAKLRVDAIACQSDFMAIGALDALKVMADKLGNPALRNMPVIGCDGMTSVGKKLVDENRLAATVIVPTTADKAIELVVADYRNEGDMSAEVLLPPRGYPDDAALIRRNRQTA
jgi:ABC-type sugar transport system substrate-binding protein